MHTFSSCEMSIKLIAPLKKDTLSELYLNKDVKKGNHFLVCEIYLKEMVFKSILSPQISMQYKN